MRSIFIKAVMATLAIQAIGVCDEPSVYGGESVYLSEDTKRLQKRIILLERKVDKLQGEIAGLRSVVEGLSGSYMQGSSTEGMEHISAKLDALQSKIDAISSDYVSRNELKGFGGSAKKSSKRSPGKSVSSKSTSLKSIYLEGVRLFGKRRYNEAKKRFEQTDAQGYRTAASNFYLGEIAYYTKNYDDAIFYYKKSAGINDRAAYIDTLLLHAGISLEKIGQKEQAERFYENIIANYGDKKSAKIAKKRLKALQ